MNDNVYFDFDYNVFSKNVKIPQFLDINDKTEILVDQTPYYKDKDKDKSESSSESSLGFSYPYTIDSKFTPTYKNYNRSPHEHHQNINDKTETVKTISIENQLNMSFSKQTWLEQGSFNA